MGSAQCKLNACKNTSYTVLGRLLPCSNTAPGEFLSTQNGSRSDVQNDLSVNVGYLLKLYEFL